MKEHLMTMNEIRKAGIDILLRELGPILTARFLQQFETGQGDYTRDRGKWLDPLTADEIFDGIQKLQKQSKQEQ